MQPDVDQGLIEYLSRHCKRVFPRHEIERLYLMVWSDLAATATIPNFLNIIATRKTADRLLEMAMERAQEESNQ